MNRRSILKALAVLPFAPKALAGVSQQPAQSKKSAYELAVAAKAKIHPPLYMHTEYYVEDIYDCMGNVVAHVYTGTMEQRPIQEHRRFSRNKEA